MKKPYLDNRFFRTDSDRYARSRLPNWKITLVILAILALYGLISKAQTAEKPKPVTQAESQNARLGADRLFWGYQPESTPGWVIKKGDTLQLGRGSLPNKDFAFFYENPNAMTASMTYDYKIVRKYLPSMYNGKRVIIKELFQAGSKKIGFTMSAMVGVGNIIRYYVELDNAIAAGEVLPPARYRPSAQAAPALPVSVADELIKLKSLLDAGAITQAEYDSQKKKLLSN